jgi:hypothetical protein
MSEHSRGFTASKWLEYTNACKEASADRLLVVPGIEYGDADDVVHVPVWGQVPFFGDGLPTGRLLAEASDAGGTAIWAHPWRRDAWRRFDPSWLDHLSAVEIWNRKYDGIVPSRHAVALARREGIRAAVSLDFHTRRQLFPLTLSLDIGGSLTETAVFIALADGRFAPRAFGLRVDHFTHGPGNVALRGLDLIRQNAARALRRGTSDRHTT